MLFLEDAFFLRVRATPPAPPPILRAVNYLRNALALSDAVCGRRSRGLLSCCAPLLNCLLYLLLAVPNSYLQHCWLVVGREGGPPILVLSKPRMLAWRLRCRPRHSLWVRGDCVLHRLLLRPKLCLHSSFHLPPLPVPRVSDNMFPKTDFWELVHSPIPRLIHFPWAKQKVHACCWQPQSVLVLKRGRWESRMGVRVLGFWNWKWGAHFVQGEQLVWASNALAINSRKWRTREREGIAGGGEKPVSGTPALWEHGGLHDPAAEKLLLPQPWTVCLCMCHMVTNIVRFFEKKILLHLL